MFHDFLNSGIGLTHIQRDKCIQAARQFLEAGLSVAVGTLRCSMLYSHKILIKSQPDNTNRDREARAHWVRVAQAFSIPIRCVLFTASPRLCEHNDVMRAHNSSVSARQCCRTNFPRSRMLTRANRSTQKVERSSPPSLFVASPKVSSSHNLTKAFKISLLFILEYVCQISPISRLTPLLQFEGTDAERELWSKYWVSKFST